MEFDCLPFDVFKFSELFHQFITEKMVTGDFGEICRTQENINKICIMSTCRNDPQE